MASTATRDDLWEATRRGLEREPRQLPTVWLYDERGSRLYEQITRLPDYYLPRREREILRERAPAIAERTRARTLVELGAGGTGNTRLLLDALETLECFVPLDVSEKILRETARAMEAGYPRLRVDAVVGDFERDLATLPRTGPRLVALLGSTIGNLYPLQRSRFLRSLAETLAPEDAFLVGLDLVKDVRRLETAYDDAAGVTETFVRNALVAVNRELGATFEQSRFAYEARWDHEHEWMSIGLRARRAHTVAVNALELDVPFEEGEPLRVEISAKFRREPFEREAGRTGLCVESWWIDRRGDFAVALLCSSPLPGNGGGEGLRLPEVLVHERDRHAALADGCGDALDRAQPNVAAREDPGHGRLEQVRVAFERPAGGTRRVGTGQDEPSGVDRDLGR
jgi:L-histidine N-alpha-methyltransferase